MIVKSYSERKNQSQSPSSRASFTDRLTTFGAKLTRTVSESSGDYGGDKDSISTKFPVLGKKERSQSRGREAYSTGRGGIGNIRQTSESRTRTEAVSGTLPDITRGREPIAAPPKAYSSGRGGAGNIRSPSRDVNAKTLDATEEEIIRNHIAASQDAPHSSGRGGLGNINSRSRSRGPGLPVHSTGRGGAGNIVSGDGNTTDVIDEEERKMYAGTGGSPAYHSTGRGGIANLTTTPQPAPEKVAHTAGEYGSTGRGGAGNIVHNN